MLMRTLWTPQALLPTGWARDVLLSIDAQGRFVSVQADQPQAALPPTVERLLGPVLPGLVNVHTHAFQRAMAGLSDGYSGQSSDTFWSWREVMYRFLATLDPDDVEAIATWLYIELVRCGFTTVVEFHYLHHDREGRPYSDRCELSLRLLRAAERAGIAITLLPVLYAHSGFGGTAPTPAQRRFVYDSDAYLRLVTELHRHTSSTQQAALVRLGVAPHSLRAVTPSELAQVISAISAIDATAPIHIHAAEQPAEVEACRATLGAPPVAWLLEHAPLDSRFCLVHATHMTAEESDRLAASGAVVGICPTTEANLGDGLFSAPRYLRAGGRIAIGTDSNVGVDPFSELRLIEYGQRLAQGRRGVLSQDGESVAMTLLRRVLMGGAQAAGQDTSQLAPGSRADLVVLDEEHPDLGGRVGAAIVDALVFSPLAAPVRDVYVGGRQVVQAGRHAALAEAKRAYQKTLSRLL
jgi:formimidoylglutamate deiminase